MNANDHLAPDWQPSTMPWTPRAVGAFTLLSLAALALRLWGLDTQSLWLDEVFVVDVAHDVEQRGLSSVAERDHVSPLSFWIVWGWLQLVPETDFNVRLPFAVAGTLMVALVYCLARRLFDDRTAAAAALLAAIGPFAVWYSQEARMYSWMMLFAAWMMLACVRAVQGSTRYFDWGSLAVASALGIYNHQFSLLLNVALSLFLLLRCGLSSPILWRGLLAQSVGLATYVPWCLLLLSRLDASTGVEKSHAWLWGPYTGFAFLYGFSLGPSVRELHTAAKTQVIVQALPVLLPLALASGWVFWSGLARLRRATWSATFLGSCILVPVGLVLAAVGITNISYNVRYVATAFPAFILIPALGLTAKGLRHLRLAHGAAVATVIAAMLWSDYQWFTDGRYGKEDARAAAAYLQQEMEPVDRLIVVSGTVFGPLRYYGLTAPESHAIVFRDDAAGAAPSSVGEPSDAPRVWLVQSRIWEADPERRIQQRLDRSRPFEHEKRWTGIEVRCYGKPHASERRPALLTDSRP